METLSGAEEKDNGAVETSLPQEAAAEDDVVELSSLQEESEGQDKGEGTVEAQDGDAQTAQEGDDGPLSRNETQNQERINEAVSRRLNAERKKLSSDPYYQLGRLYAEPFKDTAAAHEQLLKDRAEKLAEDPKALAMEVLKRGRREEPGPVPGDPRESVADIVSGLIEMGDRGELPADFNLDAYLQAAPDFISNYQQYGIRAAVKMAGLAVQGQQAAKTSAKLESNARLPQSTRPASTPREGPPDFEHMSAGEFRKWEARIQQASGQGRRVKL